MKIVVFAGGQGTRLWPLSRKKSPKQFEKIVGEKSTLQLAVDRLLPDFSINDIYIATSEPYVPIVLEQLPTIDPHHVIGEPSMRDVGPAVGLMAGILNREFSDEPMAILWSDHLVKNEVLFRRLLFIAAGFVQQHPKKIVFIAQKPRFPSENLGWIEYGKVVSVEDGVSLHQLMNFQYRPDKNTAGEYYKSGKHAWNLGYFVTTPSFLWGLYQQYEPNLHADLSRIVHAWQTAEFQDVFHSIYPKVEKIHFDNAILEKLSTADGLVISENIEWSDIGAWEALKEALQETQEQNVTRGKVLLTDTRDSLVYNFTDQMVVTIDLDDFLVVNTSDVVMVCKKSSVPKIKKLVESLSGTEYDKLT